MKRLVLSLIMPLFLAANPIFAQTSISYNGSGNYMLRERTDLRRYDNGKYIGLVSREVSSFVIPVSNENGYLYEGSFFVQQETMRAQRNVAPQIDEAIPSVFTIGTDGELKMIEDNGYPSFRSFPTFPKKAVKIGDSWTGAAIRSVDPLDKGIPTKLKFYIQYTYLRDEVFNDEEVFLIGAKWATRYGFGGGNSYMDFGGDKELSRATGTHNATIYVSKSTGNMLVMRDYLDETFEYADGFKVQFKGTVALFTEYPPAIDRDEIIINVRRLLADAGDDELESSEKTEVALASSASDTSNDSDNTKDREASDSVDTKPAVTIASIKESEYMEKFDIDVEETAAGIKLAIRNLQFKPNSPELEDGETTRLDQIAKVLKTTDSRLLVEGHTARVGDESNEQELSEERARAVAQALSERGIKTGRFICKGWGGRKPIDTNDTTEGRARNRRVEITILD